MPAPLSLPLRILGERVRASRAALGVSQETLADLCGVHWTFIGQIERGRRNLNLHNLLKIAAGLGVDPAELVRGLKPPPSKPKVIRGRPIHVHLVPGHERTSVRN